jgi:hypothetical protein
MDKVQKLNNFIDILFITCKQNAEEKIWTEDN